MGWDDGRLEQGSDGCVRSVVVGIDTVLEYV